VKTSQPERQFAARPTVRTESKERAADENETRTV
jgi:hypothetical protein